MLQYQSFPDARGDSATLEKLQSLRLPGMVGGRFLDVGCNEGFFCGFACFAGAAEVIGIDHSELFLARAKKRFPQVTFLHQTWDVLPPGPFDVILLASALHYADDQALLIQRLMQLLAPGGTLVLELGVVESAENSWQLVKRGIDQRYFPTWPKLYEVLMPYAWKLIASSVNQAGDPVARHVLHITQKKPFAYLLLQPPGYGKSSMVRQLFEPAQVPVIAGDHCLTLIAAHSLPVSPALQAIVSANFSPEKLDWTIRAIFDGGLCQQWVEVWLQRAEGKNFVVDSYVPPDYQHEVQQIIRDRGFIVVALDWERPNAAMRTHESCVNMAQGYYSHLQVSKAGVAQVAQVQLPFIGITGYLDHIVQADGKIQLQGWALHESGRMPERIVVTLDQQSHQFVGYERTARPDVQAHYGLPDAILGFSLMLDAPADCSNLARRITLYCSMQGEELQGPLMAGPGLH